MNTSPSRSLFPILAFAIGTTAAAQDLFVGGSSLLRITPGGVATTVTFPGPGMVPITGTAFEVDLRDPNNLISAALLPTTGEVGIFRTVLGGVAGAVAQTQTLMCTLTGTAGSTIFAGDMHRAPDGSFVLLSRGLSPSGFRLDRIGLTRGAGIATEIPINNPGAFFPNSISEIAVDNLGTIFLTGPGSTSLGGRIFRLPPAGGNATVFHTSPVVDFYSVEVQPNGNLCGGGITIFPITPGGPYNFVCNITGSGGSPAGVGPIGTFIPGVVDLHIDENGETLMVCQTSVSTTIERHGPNCTVPATPVIATVAPGFTKVTRDFVARQPEFGASAPWAISFMARCFESTAPVINSIWGISVTAAQPNALFILSAGGTELPAPVDLGPLGAPGSALYQSNDATASGACDGFGNATFIVAVPNNPALIGSAQFAQYALLTSFTPLGLVLTNAIHSIVL
jgi:hypothetical protein